MPRDRATSFKNRVGFADKLHVAVFDSVVDHFHVMTGAIRSHVAAAWFAIDLRGDLAENRRDHFPRFARTAGHERRTFERAFFAAGNAAADKVKSASFEIFAAPLRVGEKRIAAVDDDVAFFQKRRELADDRIDRRAGFDHDHRFARPLQRADELFHRVGRLDVFSFAASGQNLSVTSVRAVEHGDGKSFRFHVEDEVFAHHRETDQSNIALIRGHFAYLLAGAGHHSPRYTRPWQFPFWEVSITSDRLEFAGATRSIRRRARWSIFWGVVRATRRR